MSQVSWNRQLGLAVALFGLGTLAYWLEYKHKPEKESSEEQSKKVFSLKDSPVKSVTLTDGSRVFSLSCNDFDAQLCKAEDNSKWSLTEPLQVKADDSNANTFLSTLNTLNTQETIDLKEESPEKKAALLKEYGLDPQALQSNRKIRITTAKGETILYLGLPHPIGESIFAAREDLAPGQAPAGKIDTNRVLLIPSYFKSNFDRDLTYWRDKKLLTLGAHDIASFKLEGPKAHLSAEKKETQWILHAQGEELPGDLENINSFLTTASNVTAKAFVANRKTDPASKAALKGAIPVLSVTFQKEKGTAKDLPPPLTLTLFEKKESLGSGKDKGPLGKLYATVSTLDPLYELDLPAKERLNKSVNELRMSKLMTAMERFSVKRLEFSGAPIGSTPLILTSADGKWSIQPSEQGPASPEKVQILLDKMSGNRIRNFYTGASIPLGENKGLKVTFGDEKNPTLRQLVFWKKEDQLFARDLQSKRQEAFLVDPSVKDVLPWETGYFKINDAKTGVKSDTPKK